MAGSKSESFENDLLNFIFNSVAIPDLGTDVYIRLYNTDVVVNNTTVGTEAIYDGYVAGGVAIPRSVAGFTPATSSISKNVGEFAFAKCLSGDEVLRYFAVFKDNTTFTESHRLYWGPLPADLEVSTDTIPTVPAEYLTINEL